MNEIFTAISSVGFPIVACVGMGYFFTKLNETYRQDIKELQKEYQQVVKDTTEAINNNTNMVQRLIDKLGERNEG